MKCKMYQLQFFFNLITSNQVALTSLQVFPLPTLFVANETRFARVSQSYRRNKQIPKSAVTRKSCDWSSCCYSEIKIFIVKNVNMFKYILYEAHQLHNEFSFKFNHNFILPFIICLYFIGCRYFSM